MTKAYLVWWSNGEMYREDQESDIVGVFSTKEKAQAYVENWKAEYKTKAEEFYRARGEVWIDEDFKIDFPERVWIAEWDLQ